MPYYTTYACSSPTPSVSCASTCKLHIRSQSLKCLDAPMLLSQLLRAARRCLELLGAARSCSGLLGTAWGCSELLGAARSCSELLKGARSCSGLLGGARGCLELIGAARSCSWLLGPTRSCSELLGAAWSCSERLHQEADRIRRPLEHSIKCLRSLSLPPHQPGFYVCRVLSLVRCNLLLLDVVSRETRNPARSNQVYLQAESRCILGEMLDKSKLLPYIFMIVLVHFVFTDSTDSMVTIIR